MARASDYRSGKTHRDENFPVASLLFAPQHRAPIVCFYEFVRTADDIADHPTLGEADKLHALDRLEKSLVGRSDADAEGVSLRHVLAERGLPTRHAQDLLTAFRMDVTKRRYRDWDDLVNYCKYSAMPVGRYVLDVHGESRETWKASDAICAVLQIINHIQDCQKDYRSLDRVYIPQDALDAAGTSVAALDESRASPQLRECLRGLAARTELYLREGDPLPDLIRNTRASLWVSVVQELAQRLVTVLQHRDPLSESVHFGKAAFAGIGMIGLVKGVSRRLSRRFAGMES
ncbi:MAG TPA: squalene synthase HpnC [Pseudorhodoplanes sp.]|jgi:squalene synthase HpnC|nr:squalene synthase HpnC [Pseudorhodoplanes sp.]